MRSTGIHFTSLLTAALLSAPVVCEAGQAPAGPVAVESRQPEPAPPHGFVVDESAAVLPGVTVTVVAADGRPLAGTVTDESGRFVFERPPDAAHALTFTLNGFEPATTTIRNRTTANGDEGIVQRLQLAARTEQVTVHGDPPPPPPSLEPVPVHDQASVCGPAMAEPEVPAFGTVVSRRHDDAKVLFSAGDQLLIDGGEQTGLRVGQNFVVRRRYPTPLRYGRNQAVTGEHTAGLLQIVEVQPALATAVVVYACNEIMRGDYLAPFEPEPPVVAEPPGAPEFDAAARILFGDLGEPLGVTGRMLVVDLGKRHGVRRGQRLTFFRRSRFGDARPYIVGEGVVVAVRRDTSTVRVEHATDVIFFGAAGDWAAPQQPGASTRR